VAEPGEHEGAGGDPGDSQGEQAWVAQDQDTSAVSSVARGFRSWGRNWGMANAAAAIGRKSGRSVRDAAKDALNGLQGTLVVDATDVTT
jgi:hypothetical protein